jgi:hypothetical protein
MNILDRFPDSEFEGEDGIFSESLEMTYDTATKAKREGTGLTLRYRLDESGEAIATLFEETGMRDNAGEIEVKGKMTTDEALEFLLALADEE